MNTANEDLDCLTTAVINIDCAHKIVSINSATESLFGLSKTNLSPKLRKLKEIKLSNTSQTPKDELPFLIL
jgi:nitrogen-specific signal transduction histidine kinase